MNHSENNNHMIRIFDLVLAISLSVIILPLTLISILISLAHKKNPVQFIHTYNLAGDSIILKKWSSPPMQKTALLLDVILGKISFCGIPISKSTHTPRKTVNTSLQTGIYSLFENTQRAAISNLDIRTAIAKHEHNNHLSFHIKILIQGLINQITANKEKLKDYHIFSVFGIKINNLTMAEAVHWVTSSDNSHYCRIAYFVNTHSINLSFDNPQLKDCINKADRVFADGAGVRIAARHIGIHLKENVNGTDMLPLLCDNASRKNKSIFLLGGKFDIAEKAKKCLLKQYPNLVIAGTHHGFFDQKNSSEIIRMVNDSGADILLLGLGSPHQEIWLAENRHRLSTGTALAVGGLFDFFSGRIPRAPSWLREAGMEWVFRLLMEPRAKFRRYVLGNPLFIWRVLFSKHI